MNRGLNKKNLDRVWAWVEAHEEHPVAEAYLGACSAIGGIEEDECMATLRHWRGRKRYSYPYVAEVYGWRYDALNLRDRIGRVILDRLMGSDGDAAVHPDTPVSSAVIAGPVAQMVRAEDS